MSDQTFQAPSDSSDASSNGPEDSSAVGESTQGGDTSQQEAAINPAWNKMLEGIPSSLHPMVTPHLKEWDSNFQKKLHEVQSQYAPFDAFKDTPPEQLQGALDFYRVMESNPEAVYQQMQEFYGFGGGDQGQQAQDDSGDAEEFDIEGDDILQHPKVQELLQNQEVMAQFLVQQQEQEQYAQFEEQIDSEVSTILEANPDFDDEDQTLMFQIAAASGISLTDAAKQVNGHNANIAQRSAAPKAPSVMGANGFVPAAQNVDPTKLDGKGTRALVADLLNQAREQNG